MADTDDLLLENQGREEEFEDRELQDEVLLRAAEQPSVCADDAITLEQARAFSGRRGARLVFLMGEAQTGKTALVAMLWQHLLEEGGIGDHRLAGSRTAFGFERRAHWARLEARQPEARFPATRFEDGAVLHLRVRRPDGRRVELLLSDLAGEQFERVREGRFLLDEVPWARRADRFVVVVDAKALSLPGESEVVATRAQRLLRALQVSTAVRDSARVAVVITKADALNQAGEKALERHEPALLAVARESDSEAICLRVAAVPGDGTPPQGLGELITWLCCDDRPHIATAVRDVAPQRSIATFRASPPT